VLAEAAQLLTYLEKQGAAPLGRAVSVTNGAGVPATVSVPLVHDLLHLDLCAMTPLQALTLLHHLQQQARTLTGNGGALS
jgi:hypothetical protein